MRVEGRQAGRQGHKEHWGIWIQSCVDDGAMCR